MDAIKGYIYIYDTRKRPFMLISLSQNYEIKLAWTFGDLKFCGFSLMKIKRGFPMLCKKVQI
jgi:hypothetical protein